MNPSNATTQANGSNGTSATGIRLPGTATTAPANNAAPQPNATMTQIVATTTMAAGTGSVLTATATTTTTTATGMPMAMVGTVGTTAGAASMMAGATTMVTGNAKNVAGNTVAAAVIPLPSHPSPMRGTFYTTCKHFPITNMLTKAMRLNAMYAALFHQDPLTLHKRMVALTT